MSELPMQKLMTMKTARHVSARRLLYEVGTSAAGFHLTSHGRLAARHASHEI